MPNPENPERRPSLRVPPVLAEFAPDTAIVLGSGLGSFVDELDVCAAVGFGEIAGLPVSAAPGHAGRMVCGTLGGARVIAAQGRVHLYEGWSAEEVAAPIRLFAGIGVRRVFLTNAAGALNENFAVGEWMVLTDHLNLTGVSPLTGGPEFCDMTEVYTASLRERMLAVAAAAGVPLFSGVYAGVPGPQYETPAEIRMLRTLGADAVGMSTVLEAIQARALGLEVAAVSCLTNWAAGITGRPLDHAEVLDAGARAASRLAPILEQTLLA